MILKLIGYTSTCLYRLRKEVKKIIFLKVQNKKESFKIKLVKEKSCGLSSKINRCNVKDEKIRVYLQS